MPTQITFSVQYHTGNHHYVIKANQHPLAACADAFTAAILLDLIIATPKAVQRRLYAVACTH